MKQTNLSPGWTRALLILALVITPTVWSTGVFADWVYGGGQVWETTVGGLGYYLEIAGGLGQPPEFGNQSQIDPISYNQQALNDAYALDAGNWAAVYVNLGNGFNNPGMVGGLHTAGANGFYTDMQTLLNWAKYVVVGLFILGLVIAFVWKGNTFFRPPTKRRKIFFHVMVFFFLCNLARACPSGCSECWTMQLTGVCEEMCLTPAPGGGILSSPVGPVTCPGAGGAVGAAAPMWNGSNSLVQSYNQSGSNSVVSTNMNLDTNAVCAVTLFGSNYVLNSSVSFNGYTNDPSREGASFMSNEVDRIQTLGSPGTIAAMQDWTTNYVTGHDSGIQYFDDQTGLGFYPGLNNYGVSWGKGSLTSASAPDGVGPSGAKIDVLFGAAGVLGGGGTFQTAAAGKVLLALRNAGDNVQSYTNSLRACMRALAALEALTMMCWVGWFGVQYLWKGGFPTQPTGETGELLGFGGNANVLAQKVNSGLITKMCFIVITMTAVQVSNFIARHSITFWSPWHLAHSVTYSGMFNGNDWFDVLDRYFDFGTCCSYITDGCIGTMWIIFTIAGCRLTIEYLKA